MEKDSFTIPQFEGILWITIANVLGVPQNHIRIQMDENCLPGDDNGKLYVFGLTTYNVYHFTKNRGAHVTIEIFNLWLYCKNKIMNQNTLSIYND